MTRTALAVTVALLLAGGGWVAGQQAQVPLKNGEWVEAHAVPSRGFVVPVDVK